MVIKRFDIEFKKDGRIHDESQVDELLAGLPGVTDLLVVSHGWNNDMAEARKLYDVLLGNVDMLLGMGTQLPHLTQLTSRKFAACQVFWPSKKFTEEELIPGGGAASLENESKSDVALHAVLDRLAEDPERLGDTDAPKSRKDLVKHAKRLIPELDTSSDARTDFVVTLRKLLDPGHATRDDASEEFFTEKPSTLFEHFEGEVIAPGAVSRGGAAAVTTGGAAGVRDMLHGARAAARRIANFATYYQMKGRADTVGRNGVAQVLGRVRKQSATVRLHLVGHSFGGRLVTAAAHALPDNSPAVTVSLLQAAYSHNGLSGNFENGEPGFYRDVIAKRKASGPIIITYTKNDQAVGIAYPLASRVAFQKASAFGDADDPYGGMGRNGAQRTVEVSGTDKALQGVGHKYGFKSGAVYNLVADEFIADHGAVDGPQVAYAILATACAVQ